MKRPYFARANEGIFPDRSNTERLLWASIADDVFDALERHLQSIGERDVEAFEKTLRRDAQVMGPDGSIIAGREAVVVAHREWFSSTEFTFEPKIEWQCESGDLGIALVRVHYVERKKAPRSFFLLLAFAKDGDRWEMFYDQNTPIGS